MAELGDSGVQGVSRAGTRVRRVFHGRAEWWTEGDAAKSARNPAMDAGIHGGGTAGEERSREGASWAGAMREAGERDGRESPTAGG